MFIFCACTGLFLMGCLELVRRPTAASEASAPEWESSGNSPAAEGVKQDTATASSDGSSPERDIFSAVATNTLGDSTSITSVEPQIAEAVLAASASRSSDRRREVGQVNEYALWCIQNEMWEEARLHLERSVARDSLAASLHNNLGVVYERLGQRERAESGYERARLLQPQKDAYQSNLARLQDRKRAASKPPTADEADSLKTGLEIEEEEALIDSLETRGGLPPRSYP